MPPIRSHDLNQAEHDEALGTVYPEDRTGGAVVKELARATQLTRSDRITEYAHTQPKNSPRPADSPAAHAPKP